MVSDLDIGSFRELILKPLWANVTVASGLLEGVGKCSVMGPLKVDIVAAVLCWAMISWVCLFLLLVRSHMKWLSAMNLK